ncbi:MAG: ABC transporter substrate-binding protein, partial [Actinomycetota bacterium]
NSSSGGSSSPTTEPSGGGPATTASPSDLKKNVPVDAPGVSATEIAVDVIAAKTNNPTGSYAPFVEGIKAYFNYRNTEDGGIYGRKLVVGKDLDDQLGSNAQRVQESLAQNRGFATFVATPLFTGADALARAEQPTFIWNINPEFAGKPTFFANVGALCFDCPGHSLPFLAEQLGVEKVGVLAYGVAAQSVDCAAGIKKSFEAYPTAEVVFFDDTLGYAAPVGSQVSEMKKKGVEFIATCVDLQESYTIAKELNKQGLQAVQQLPNGYDPEFVAKNGELLEGSIVSPQFTAFEHEPKIPEIEKFFEWIEKEGAEPGELSATGWQLADQLYTGLVGAGPEFSQTKMVSYLNTLTAYSDNGFLAPINWTIAHNDPTKDPSVRGKDQCANYVRIEGGKFVSAFGKPGRPWVCFRTDDPSVDNPRYENFAPKP